MCVSVCVCVNSEANVGSPNIIFCYPNTEHRSQVLIEERGQELGKNKTDAAGFHSVPDCQSQESHVVPAEPQVFDFASKLFCFSPKKQLF